MGSFIVKCKRLIKNSAVPLCAQFKYLCITRFISARITETPQSGVSMCATVQRLQIVS